jgi:hypothetical protein
MLLLARLIALSLMGLSVWLSWSWWQIHPVAGALVLALCWSVTLLVFGLVTYVGAPGHPKRFGES